MDINHWPNTYQRNLTNKDVIIFYQSLKYECNCGAVKVCIKPTSMFRTYCHCTYCQKSTGKAYADEIISLAKDVIVEGRDAIIFTKNNALFPMQRGMCQACKAPVLSYAALLPGLKVAVMPTLLCGPAVIIPKAVAHVFYHRKIRDIEDNLPKLNSYLSSQLVTVKFVILLLYKRLIT